MPGAIEELPAEEEQESPPAFPADELSAGPIRHMQDVFSNWWRRAILYYLTEEGPASLTALTRRLLRWAWDRDGAPSLKTTGLLKHTRHTLRQGHVTELAAFGLIGFDPDAGRVWLPEDVTVTVPPPWE